MKIFQDISSQLKTKHWSSGTTCSTLGLQRHI